MLLFSSRATGIINKRRVCFERDEVSPALTGSREKRVEGHIDPLVRESKKQTLRCPLFPINYCLMLIKEGGMGHVMKHNYSLQHFPSMSLVPPPLVLSEEAARAVSRVKQAKMSPQPFKGGRGEQGEGRHLPE